MPIIVDERTGREREVDDATYRRMRHETASEQPNRDALITLSRDGPAPIALWDCIDNTWTKPLPSETCTTYLRKQVFKCSLCDYTTIWRAGATGILAHVSQVKERFAEHEGAALGEPTLNEGVPIRICSGCGYAFQAASGMKHLNQVIEMGVVHRTEVEGLLINRFALGPSEPVVHHREMLSAGLEVHPEELATPPQKSRRRKRRKRGSRDD
jgi:hypothetical protein